MQCGLGLAIRGGLFPNGNPGNLEKSDPAGEAKWRKAPIIVRLKFSVIHLRIKYDTIKRSMTQMLNKGIVCETWGTKCYWVIQEYIYLNLINRYGLKKEGYEPEHASRFALYNLVPQVDRLTLQPGRIVSTTVDEVYQAMRNNPGLPSKDFLWRG